MMCSLSVSHSFHFSFTMIRKVALLVIIKVIFHVGIHAFLSLPKNRTPFLSGRSSNNNRFQEYQQQQSASIHYLSSSSSSSQDDYITDDDVPSFMKSIVLKQVYPAMMKHIAEFGNPNIPLGSIDGKRCKTLRRLAFENKLTNEEIEFLDGINFRLNSLEDVYEDADFDECLERLIMYV